MSQLLRESFQPHHLLYKPPMQVHIGAPYPCAVLVQLQSTQQCVLDGLHGRLDALGPHQPPDQVALSVRDYPRRGRHLTPSPTSHCAW